MSKKFNVSLGDEVFEKLDVFSKQKNLSRSAVISIAVQQYIEAQEKIPEVEKSLDKLGDLLPFLKPEIVSELKGRLEDVKLENGKD